MAEITLPEHEENSEKRARMIEQKINELKEAPNMSEHQPVNVFTTPAAAPIVGGYGNDMGGMGGLLALALLGGGLGRRDGFVGEPCGAEKVAVMTAGFDGINHNINTSMMGLTNQLGQGFASQNNLDVMAKLGTIEGAIPLAEAQVQLAIAGSTASINQNIANGLQVAIQGQAGINKNIADAIASSLASQNNINQNILTTTAGLQLQASQNTGAILAEINRLNTDNLSRQLTVADLDRRDEVNRGRTREVEVNVAQTVNQVQAQAQQQQQQQQITTLLTHLCGVVGNLQSAVATNSNLIVGNTGATTTGAQTANPVNVKG